MNEIKALSVLMGADEKKVQKIVRAIMDAVMECDASLEEFAAALGAITLNAEEVKGEVKTVKDFYESLTELAVAAFED